MCCVFVVGCGDEVEGFELFRILLYCVYVFVESLSMFNGFVRKGFCVKKICFCEVLVRGLKMVWDFVYCRCVICLRVFEDDSFG